MRSVEDVLECLAEATAGLVTGISGLTDADVRATASALADAAAQLPPGAWQNLVTWTTGQQTPAEMVARSRLAEVLIHQVDLGIGFGPGDWPAAFIREMLTTVVGALNDRSLAPLTARLDAPDTGRWFQIGGAADAVHISGTEPELLAWLLGRVECRFHRVPEGSPTP